MLFKTGVNQNENSLPHSRNLKLGNMEIKLTKERIKKNQGEEELLKEFLRKNLVLEQWT